MQLDQWRRQFGAENLVACRGCGRILLPGRAARGYCADRDCLVIQHAAQGRADQAAREIAYANQVQAAFALRAEQAAAAGRPGVADFHPVVVPQFKPTLAPADPVRRQNLSVWLQSLLASAPAPIASAAAIPCDPQLESDRPDELAIYRTGCRLCQGACCRNAGDSAYLDGATLTRVQRSFPGRSADDWQAEYLAHVPSHSVERSCIYHGAEGCTLPRHLRAEICNQFLCGGLLHARDLVRRDGVRRLYMIAAEGQSFGEGAFLDLDQVDAQRAGASTASRETRKNEPDSSASAAAGE